MCGLIVRARVVLIVHSCVDICIAIQFDVDVLLGRSTARPQNDS